ncbi:GH17483 [Drosophila grimshawi]|uniref:GH17483 n=1 Tax=Drosophila grimshawi TaxID=7222 RepID=B4JTT6_DROGR|nr:GH17483 [Drosophila grimshawi]
MGVILNFVRRICDYALGNSKKKRRVTFTRSAINRDRERILESIALAIPLENFLNDLLLAKLEEPGRVRVTACQLSQLRKTALRKWNELPEEQKEKYMRLALNPIDMRCPPTDISDLAHLVLESRRTARGRRPTSRKRKIQRKMICKRRRNKSFHGLQSLLHLSPSHADLAIAAPTEVHKLSTEQECRSCQAFNLAQSEPLPRQSRKSTRKKKTTSGSKRKIHHKTNWKRPGSRSNTAFDSIHYQTLRSVPSNCQAHRSGQEMELPAAEAEAAAAAAAPWTQLKRKIRRVAF